jgi:hypothetical protein
MGLLRALHSLGQFRSCHLGAPMVGPEALLDDSQRFPKRHLSFLPQAILDPK